MNMTEPDSADTAPANASETNVTDIELMPDGRIFVFGTSRQVLEVLSELQTTGNGQILARLNTCDQEFPSTVPNRGSSS
jgi:hypothetical protein